MMWVITRIVIGAGIVTLGSMVLIAAWCLGAYLRGPAPVRACTECGQILEPFELTQCTPCHTAGVMMRAAEEYRLKKRGHPPAA